VTLIDKLFPFVREVRPLGPISYLAPYTFLVTSAIVSRGQKSDVLAIGVVNKGSTDNSETSRGDPWIPVCDVMGTICVITSYVFHFHAFAVRSNDCKAIE